MNFKIVEKWVTFLQKGAENKGLLFLPDIKNSIAQLIYSELAEISQTEKGLIINLEKADDLLSGCFDDPVKKILHVLAENNADLSLYLNKGKLVSVSESGLCSIIPDKKIIEFVFN